MILQKPVLEVSDEQHGDKVLSFLSWLFSVAVRLLFDFTTYLLYPTQTVPCPNYSDR